MIKNTFNKLLSIVWPIRSHETKKFVPLVFILFLLSFNQSVLWNIKDTLVITSSGAESIPFIKVWAILPGAFLLTFIFTKLSNRYRQEKVFYLITGSFLLLYGVFAFGAYPYRELLHPLASADYLESLLPSGCKGLISMYRYWTYTLFFVLCELWTTMVITVLFWSFANTITLLSEVKRFYSVLSIIYCIGIIAAGAVSLAIAHDSLGLQISTLLAWEHTMQALILVVIANGVLAILLYRWMHQISLQSIDCEQGTHEEPKQIKLSLWESLVNVGRSKYLMCMAVIVIAYNLVINLAEVTWKDQLSQLHPNNIDYNNYITNLQIIQGILAIIVSLSMTQILEYFGWAKTALITPVIMLLSCIFFFGILILKNYEFVGMSSLTVVVFFGAVQNSLSKACKYTLFDSTKEMAFVPLSSENKLKGKAAIDGVGARIGKSGGSLIHQALLITFASLSASAPYLGIILLIVMSLWIMCIRLLDNQLRVHFK